MTRNISFIIPAFNEEAYIVDCVASIRAAMLRNTMNYEIIVVDDHSTDDTYWKAIETKASVIFNSGKGLVEARQTGFEVSDFKLLAFIDADNRLPPTWIPEALKYFDDEEVVAVTGPLRFYDMPLWFRAAARIFHAAAKISHKSRPMIQGGNFILRKSALTVVGGFDTAFTFYGEDTRTATQLSEVGKIVYNPKMYIMSSGRRFVQGGVVTTTLTYITNYLYVSFFRKPITQRHTDYR